MADLVESTNISTSISFEEMKTEFMAMDQEIKEKALEIDQLRQALRKTEIRLGEREDVCNKMVDQMEELHENLAELDSRFESSQENNKRLINEKEELSREMEKEIKGLQQGMELTERRYCSKVDELTTEINMITKQKDYIIKEKMEEISTLTEDKEETEADLNDTKLELSKIQEDYQKYQTEAINKIETLRSTFKHSIENAKQPITSYLEKNKGSKMPMKKTKGYRILKSTENELNNILVASTNNDL